MATFSIMEVIEQAVQTEVLGHDFYSAMASKYAENDGLRNLFQKLAQKELVHKRRFEELKEVTGEEEPLDWEEVAHYFRAIVESEFFLGKGKSLPELHHIKNPEDAVTHAIRFEKETLLYFLGLRDVVRDKEIVDEIISEEKSHIKWLSAFGKDMVK